MNYKRRHQLGVTGYMVVDGRWFEIPLLMRDGLVIYEGKMGSKTFKDDARHKAMNVGVLLKTNDIKEGDVVDHSDRNRNRIG